MSSKIYRIIGNVENNVNVHKLEKGPETNSNYVVSIKVEEK